MNTHIERSADERLQEVARRFHYPPTPDVTAVVLKRLDSGSRPRVRMRSAWAVASLVILLLAVLFAVPGVRAEIVRFFQVGVVRIFPPSPAPTVLAPTALPSLPQIPLTATPAAMLPITATPRPVDHEPPYRVTLSNIAGETTLKEAQAKVSFPIRLPKYPADLGQPDLVFLQEDRQMVILVWADPADPQKARLSLHEIVPGSIWVEKFEPVVIQETQVNGQYAVWAQGPYLVKLTNGDYDFRRIVEGNTLIWEEDNITYRLETDQTLEDAIKIAESLK